MAAMAGVVATQPAGGSASGAPAATPGQLSHACAGAVAAGRGRVSASPVRLQVYWQKLQGGSALGASSVSMAHVCFSRPLSGSLNSAAGSLASFIFMLRLGDSKRL